jgi:imidazolonepropionase
MIIANCVVSRCNQLLTCRGPIPKRGEDLKDIGVINNGSIASSEGFIVFVGRDEEGAVSADYLIAITEEGINTLAQSQTVARLLPGVSYFLMQENKAPARKLIDKGGIVALATDFDPGSSMTESLFFIMQLAIFTPKMSIEEAINAITANASYALTREREIGSLEIGKKMDLVLCSCPNYLHLVYHYSINPINHAIKEGQVVLKDRILQHTGQKEA